MNINLPLAATFSMIIQFVYVLARFSGLVIFVPFWSNGAVPTKVRVLLALILALVAYPVVYQGSTPATVSVANLGTVVINVFGELFIGFAIGLVVQCVFAGIELAGQMIGFQVGLSVVNAIDPQSQVRVPTVSAFLTFFASVVFLAMDAHHWCLVAVFKSYETVPVGGVHLTGSVMDYLLMLGGQIFATGLQLSAAVVAVLVVVDISLGIITRAAPQIQVLVISFPIKVLAGTATLGFSLYFFPVAVERYLLKMQTSLFKVISLLHG